MWRKQLPGARQLEALGDKGRRLGAGMADRVEPVMSKLQVTQAACPAAQPPCVLASCHTWIDTRQGLSPYLFHPTRMRRHMQLRQLAGCGCSVCKMSIRAACCAPFLEAHHQATEPLLCCLKPKRAAAQRLLLAQAAGSRAAAALHMITAAGAAAAAQADTWLLAAWAWLAAAWAHLAAALQRVYASARQRLPSGGGGGATGASA